MRPPSLSSFASGRIVLVVVVVWLTTSVVLFTLGPYPVVTELAQGLEHLDARMHYSWQDAMIFLAMLGEDGRQAYRAFLVADLGHAILVAVTFTLLLAFLADKLRLAGRVAGWLIYLPVLVGVLEMVENTALLSALATFQDVPEGVIQVATMATGAKLLLTPVVLFLTVAGLVAWGVTARRRPA